MSIVDVPVMVLADIVSLTGADAIGRLELANVCSKLERAVEYKTPRTTIVEDVLKAMERSKVNVTRETLHRLLFDDIFDVGYQPTEMDLSIVHEEKEDANEPSIHPSLPMIMLARLASLTLHDANLSDALFGRIVNTLQCLSYVELDDCRGAPFGPRATVTGKAVPWTLRLVDMQFSLKQIQDRFRPEEGKRAHLRYLVCVGCTIRRKRNSSPEDWLKMYTGDNENEDVVRQANLVAVSDRWLRTEPLDTFHESAAFMPLGEMMRRRPTEFSGVSRPIVSMAALIKSLEDQTLLNGPQRLRFGVDGRDGPLDATTVMHFERLQDLREIEILDTEITDEFFEGLINTCGNLAKVSLLRCTGATFKDVRFAPKSVRWSLILTEMRVDAVALMKACAPHSFSNTLESLQMNDCDFY